MIALLPPVDVARLRALATPDGRDPWQRIQQETGEEWQAYWIRMGVLAFMTNHPRAARWRVQRQGHSLVHEAVFRVAAEAPLSVLCDVDSFCARVEALAAADPDDLVPPQ